MSDLHHLLESLARNLYWNVGANVIQWTTILFWGIAMAGMWHVSCDAHLWCWRPGRQEVKGTSWKTCSNHATPEHHARMRQLHHAKHPNRVGPQSED